MSSSTEIKKIVLHTENMGKEKNDPMQKVDMVISHISNCILELNNNRGSIDRMPEMTKALAKLLEARWYFSQEFPGDGL